MRTIRTISLLTVAVGLGLSFPATAQMYPGQDVVVNPDAIPRGGLLPGEPYPGIKLHRPHRHHHPVVAKADTAPPPTATSADMTIDNADATPAPPPPAPKHQKRTTAAAAPAAADNGMGFSFGDDESQIVPPQKPEKTASNERPSKTSGDEQQQGLAKRGTIQFEHSATDPNPSQMDGIKLLAGDLNSALQAGATQIQLEAFGGAPGDKSSEARRIALKRALAIRQLLIDNGVPAGRIITKAMGGATDNGEPDRVDIYVRAS